MAKDRGRRKRSISKKSPQHSTSYDYHHLLYQRRHWDSGYAKALRNHPYMGKKIPRNTLHRIIHEKLHDIPCPNDSICRKVYLALLAEEKAGRIDPKHDTIEQRLDWLIAQLLEDCPATVAILKWQRDIVSKFYTSKDPE